MSSVVAHAWRGLWRENPALVQLLGLCPLLAVSNSVVNGVGLGLATAVALLIASSAVSASRRWVDPQIRLPVYVLILASAVTVVDLGLAAWASELHARLGIFIPLIVTNCAVLARCETYASKHSIRDAALDAFFMGLGFGAILVALGAFRELLGAGTLFAGAEALVGEVGRAWEVQVFDNQQLLLAVLPPGAFLSLALLSVIRNVLDRKRAEATI